MKDSIKDGIRIVFKNGLSVVAAYLTAKGIEIDPDFVGVVTVTGAGVVNWLLNKASEAILNAESVPDILKSAVRFFWSPPSY